MRFMNRPKALSIDASVAWKSSLPGPAAWATSSGPRKWPQARLGRRPPAAAPAYASPMSSIVLRSRKGQSYRAYEAMTATVFFTCTAAPRATGVVTATVSAGRRS